MVVTAAAIGVPHRARAQATGVQDALARLFTVKPVQAQWFAASFPGGLPPAQWSAIVDDIVAALGPYASTAPNGQAYTVSFARGSVQAAATVDASGAFTGLLLSKMQSQLALDRLNGLFHTVPVPADWFSSDFLNEIPAIRINALTASMKEQLGALQSITPNKDGTYAVVCAKGSSTAEIFINGAGKIVGLTFQ